MGFLTKVITRLSGQSLWVQDRGFDRKYAIQTGGYLVLGHAHAEEVEYVEHGVDYQGTPASELRRMMRHVPVQPADFTFVDFGCGLGRMLFAAHDLGFRSMIGIEYSPIFHGRLLDNIARARVSSEDRARFSSFRGDARRYSIPTNEDAVLYFFNPFDHTVLDVVASNVVESFDERPRRLFVVYYNPLSREVFDHSPRFRLLHEGPGHYSWSRRWRLGHAIYQVVPR